MKRIVAIALAVICVFALVACGGSNEPQPTPNELYKAEAKDFIDAFSATDIKRLDVTVTVDGSLGELTSTYTTVYNEDSTSTMTYRIETIAGLDSEEDSKVTEGTVTCDKNGNYSDGGLVSGTLAATGAKFNINSDLIENYEVAGDTLTITVDKDDSVSVIGASAMSDVIIVISKTSSNCITSVVLKYEGLDGNVSIVCLYN